MTLFESSSDRGTLGVSVVVCSRDRAEHLATCLTALTRAMRPQDEIIVVDSASRDFRTQQVAFDHPVRFVRCERPGLSHARNAGVDVAARDVIAFTDDDCRPQPGWTAALAAAFEASEVSFAFGRVIGSADGVPVSVTVREEPQRIDPSCELASIGHGANMAFRRSALQSIGGFDEVLGAGGTLRAGEDKDAVWRLLCDGLVGAYVPDAVVEHVLWRSRGQAVRLSYGYGLGWGALSAKAIRDNRQSGQGLLQAGLGTLGLRQVWRDLRAGYATGTASSLAWTVGVAVGVCRGWSLPVHNGRFVTEEVLRELTPTDLSLPKDQRDESIPA
jgi:glycosyltransferase involved in cell wall biosynthesis